jgi:CheY-like chemotaxis protein
MINEKLILLIDDDTDDQEIFRDALQKVDGSIALQIAQDGQEGLRQLEQLPLPRLIFLDLNMPRLDGKGFLKAFSEQDHFSKVPVIIYSTSSNPDEQKQMMEMGATAFMVKHHSFDDLCRALQQMLRQMQ